MPEVQGGEANGLMIVQAVPVQNALMVANPGAFRNVAAINFEMNEEDDDMEILMLKTDEYEDYKGPHLHSKLKDNDERFNSAKLTQRNIRQPPSFKAGDPDVYQLNTLLKDNDI